mgnify:CR=1 FL=1
METAFLVSRFGERCEAFFITRMRKRGTLEPAPVPRLRVRVVMTWQNTTQKCFSALGFGAGGLLTR